MAKISFELNSLGALIWPFPKYSYQKQVDIWNVEEK